MFFLLIYSIRIFSVGNIQYLHNQRPNTRSKELVAFLQPPGVNTIKWAKASEAVQKMVQVNQCFLKLLKIVLFLKKTKSFPRNCLCYYFKQNIVKIHKQKQSKRKATQFCPLFTFRKLVKSDLLYLELVRKQFYCFKHISLGFSFPKIK